MHRYVPQWDAKLISETEDKVRALHNVLRDIIDRHSSINVHISDDNKKDNDSNNDDEEANTDPLMESMEGNDVTLKGDPIALCGSFWSRTMVRDSPLYGGDDQIYQAQQAEGEGRSSDGLHGVIGNLAVDLVVTMPNSGVTMREIMDLQYVEKRDLFLEKLAEELKKEMRGAEIDNDEVQDEKIQKFEKKEKLISKVSYVKDKDNLFKPYICCEFYASLDNNSCCSNSSAATRSIFPIHIYARPPEVPVRINSEKGLKRHLQYAQEVLSDYAMPKFLSAIHKMCATSTPIMRSVIILKAWAYQCGLLKSCSMAREFSHRGQLISVAITALVLELFSTGIISPSMKEESIVRAFWVQLARGVFDGALLRLTDIGVPLLNFLHGSSRPFLMGIVKKLAEESLKFNMISDAFMDMPHKVLPLHFDVSLKVNIPSVLAMMSTVTAENVERIVAFALSDRLASPAEWSLMVDHSTTLIEDGDHKAKEDHLNTFLINIKLKSNADGRMKMTKGPSIEQTSDCDVFTEFWGSEIISTRQFADGSIRKCISWNEKVISTFSAYNYKGLVSDSQELMIPAAVVVGTIVENALRKQLKTNASKKNNSHNSSVSVDDADIECHTLFQDLGQSLVEKFGNVHIDMAPLLRRKIETACTKMSNLINQVSEKLACKTLGFDVVSSVARQCEVYPQRPHISLVPSLSATIHGVGKEGIMDDGGLLSTLPMIEPIYCVLSIDDKHKIPDTLEAISNMKGALCAQLSLVLQKSGAVESFCTKTSTDCIINGYLFRIYIAHFREVSLLRALGKSPQADMLEMKLFWTSQHYKCINTSFVQAYPTFSFATRLTKRWLGAMLLAEFVTEEAVELLMAAVYAQTPSPLTPEEGFIRFLHIVAAHKWQHEPLFVEPTRTQKSAMEVPSGRNHSSGKPNNSFLPKWDNRVQGMVIIAPYDTEFKTPFTRHTPKPMIMSRMQQLACNALNKLFTISSLKSVFADLFLCNISNSFDFVVNFSESAILSPDRCLGHCENKPFFPSRIWRTGELSGADRQRYITQLCELEIANHCLKGLRMSTRDKCMLFMDKYGPYFIAGVLLNKQPTRKQKKAVLKEIAASAPQGYLEEPIQVKEGNNEMKREGIDGKDNIKKTHALTGKGKGGKNKNKEEKRNKMNSQVSSEEKKCKVKDGEGKEQKFKKRSSMMEKEKKDQEMKFVGGKRLRENNEVDEEKQIKRGTKLAKQQQQK